MTEVIVFPDTKLLAIEYLRAQFTPRSETAIVGDRIPDQRPTRFVTVQRHGPTARRNVVIEDSTMVVTCWAATPSDADALGRLCSGLFEAMPLTDTSGLVIAVKDAELDDQRDVLSDNPFSSFAITISTRGAAA